jgi:hypothetical protein
MILRSREVKPSDQRTDDFRGMARSLSSALRVAACETGMRDTLRAVESGRRAAGERGSLGLEAESATTFAAHEKKS